MAARAKFPAALAALALVLAGLSACGERQGITADASNQYHNGAVIFEQHCSGCHSLEYAAAEGSATKVRDRERTDGPNFNVRREQVNQILYAIRNGGFSGAIMPQNIVTGADAQAVARFLAAYSGRQGSTPAAPTAQPVQSAGAENTQGAGSNTPGAVGGPGGVGTKGNPTLQAPSGTAGSIKSGQSGSTGGK